MSRRASKRTPQPRLTGGSARGRALVSVPAVGVRPTSARVREALFSILGQDLSGCSVLDAFGGSGLLGLEAWSRGAQLTVLEQDPKAAAVIRDNAAALGCPLVLHRGDTLLMSIALGTFDLVLADPPYAADPKPILAALAPCVGGRLVLETDSSATPPADVAGLHCENHRSFGTTTLWFYRGEHG